MRGPDAACQSLEPADMPHHEYGIVQRWHIPTKYLDGGAGPGLFMCSTEGDCCAPDIRSGEKVIVSPAEKPAAGDYVIIWPKTGQPIVKRLTFAVPTIPVPGPGSELMPVLLFEQTNPEKRFLIEMDKVRAVHKVIGAVLISAETGWNEDGLYLYEDPSGACFVDWIKARTKKGALRQEPLGRGIRYSRENGRRVRQVTIRLFAPQGDEEPNRDMESAIN